MYIHRVAIDTNCINAKQQLAAMNELERLHDIGLIEIVRTSTMSAELQTAIGLQRTKAARYDVIGSSSTWYLTGTPLVDAVPGTVLRGSRFQKIYESIFGAGPDGKRRGPMLAERHTQSIRDALHVDQCWQNMVDYFVTNEIRLRNCKELDFAICNPEQCLDDIRAYFRTSLGTEDIDELSEKLSQLGPIILGSNSTGAFECRLPGDQEPLLSVGLGDHELIVSCKVRDCEGAVQLTIWPDSEWEFYPGDCTILLSAGASPLRLGTRQCKSFAITSGGRAVLAGRLVRPGRLVLFEALLRAPNGKCAFVIHRRFLELHACPLTLL